MRSLLMTAPALLLVAGACATTRPAEGSTEHIVLSLQNLVCLDCGKLIEQRALAQPGVRAAHFDGTKIELALEVLPETPPQPIIAALQKEPLDGRTVVALLGPGQGRFAPFQPLKPTWDAKLLSQHGEDVGDFEPTAGRVTVVDFFADWCGPCHEMDDAMHEFLEENPTKLAYRRLNVVDWDSPLAKHYLADASELPFLIVLDTHGREVARMTGFKPQELKAAIARGQQP